MTERTITPVDRGGWWLAAGRPHPALRPHLRSYDGYWEDGAAPGRVRTLPFGAAVVIINFGPRMLLEVPGGAAGTGYGSFVAGLDDRHGWYSHPGGLSGIQLDLTPLGAYRLLGTPMGRLANIAADLGDVLGPGTGAFVERLAMTPDWAERFDLLDALLLRRLDRAPEPDPEVAWAWRRLAREHGGVGIAELAREVGWSRKHLTNRFRDQAGLPPKVMARVLRFQRAVELMGCGAPDWGGIAAACGYYDQAHLNREFRALAGCTPTALLASLAAPSRTATSGSSV